MTWTLQPIVLSLLGEDSDSTAIRHAAADARKISRLLLFPLSFGGGRIWMACYAMFVAHRVLTYGGDLRYSPYQLSWFAKYTTALAISYYIGSQISFDFHSTWLNVLFLFSGIYLFHLSVGPLFKVLFTNVVDVCVNIGNCLWILFWTLVLIPLYCWSAWRAWRAWRVHLGPTGAGASPLPQTTFPRSIGACGRSEYTYDRLTGPGKTRVIVVLPSATSRPCCDDNPYGIECRLEELDVDAEPTVRYEALSYCWGPPNGDAKYIACHGRRLRVTQTLYTALQRLRHADKERTLWVDQVCINQKDTDEKGIQILLMRSIYRHSVTTLIWLGEGEQHGGKGLEFARTIDEACERHPIAGESAFSFAFPHPGLPTPPHQCWENFFELFREPWFERVWIIQEIAVSRRSVVMYAEHEVEWPLFYRAYAYSAKLGAMNLYSGRINPNTVDNLEHLRGEIESGNQHSLLKLMTRTRPCGATDPRDKIYSLWGLAEPGSVRSLPFEPNYDETPEQLYKTFAAHILQTSNNLDLFESIHNVTNANAGVLPSWVPDWSSTCCVAPLRHTEMMFPEGEVPEVNAVGFRATNDSVSQPHFDNDMQQVTLKGHIIAAIVETSGPLNLSGPSQVGPDTQTEGEMAASHITSWIEWQAVARIDRNEDYAPGESMLDCYWKTISAGVMPGGERRCRDEFCRYDAFLRTAHGFMKIAFHILSTNGSSWIAIVAKVVSGLILWLRGYNPATLPSFRFNIGASMKRLMARLEDGRIGLVPEGSVAGDVVALLEGGKVPVVLRQYKGRSDFRILGEAYVHGVMYGEAFRPRESRGISIL